MTLRHGFKTAVAGLTTHKSRSALTILGIVIGIAAIMLMMSIGEGAQTLIVKQIQGLGSKTIVIVPGREPSGPTDPSVVETILSDSLGARELEALGKKTNVPGIEGIMPLVFGVENVSYEGDTFHATVFGSTEHLTEMFDIQPEEGTFFADADVESRADVVVVGHRVKEELFGSSDALGKRIKVKGRNLRVVGIFPQKGQVSLFNFDESIAMPYTTAQQYIFGIKHFNRLVLEAKSEDVIPQTVEDVERTLRQMHNITDPDKDDFFIVTQQGVVDQLKTVIQALTAFLSSVVAIALLVGGIGVMNIMLVSVTERTREIGLRKAIGATKHDILLQFLLEAVILTTVGGVIGIALGAFFSLAASIALTAALGLEFTFAFPAIAALLGLAVSGLVGLIFGLYPARQAARKSPIEALRYE